MSDLSQPLETISVEDAPLPPELRTRLIEHLAEDRILCLPTETVYGLAVRADRPEALEALRRAKGQNDARPFTWHVPSDNALEGCQNLAPLARRLGARYWPGPLTLVLDGVPEGLEAIAGANADVPTIGLRVPAHAATRDLLACAPFPIVMSSVNRAGDPPATRLEDAEPELLRQAAAILDAGPSRLSEASTVLRLGRGVFEVLREGLMSPADLRRTAGLSIGFCCTGNTCRSPMAEGLARDLLAQRLGTTDAGARSRSLSDFGFSVESMGVAAGPGAPASPHAVEALARKGIDISAHKSRPAVPSRILELDHVFCLTNSHRDVLLQALPPAEAGRISLLSPDGGDIPDPIGGPIEEYLDTSRAILDALERRASDWA